MVRGQTHLLLSLPLCMLGSSLAAQTVLNATDLASLRTHIATANAGAGDYVINVAAGTYTLNGAAGDASPATGDLDITKATGNVTFAGAATASTIIDANNVDRVFHINAGANVTVTFQNLTIRNGRAVDNGTAASEARGGGIYVQSSSGLTLTNVNINNCIALGANGANGAMGGAGSAGAAARGGAIYVSGGTVSITGSTLNANQATGGNGGTGGTGQANATTMTGTVSSVSYSQAFGGAGGSGGNGAAGQGGSIYMAGGNVTIAGSTLSNGAAKGGNGGAGGLGGNCTFGGFGALIVSANAGPGGDGGLSGAGAGAAIYCATGSLNISASTLNANAVTGGNGGNGGKGGVGSYTGSFAFAAVGNGGGGGAGRNGGNGQGGAIFCAGGSPVLTNSTLSANTVKGGNGGAGADGGTGAGGFSGIAAGGNGGSGGDSGNTQGGGIYMSAGSVTVNNSTNVNNALTAGARGLGGAVGAGTFTSTQVSGTDGMVLLAQGGGMFVAGGTLSITSTIVANNTGPTAANGIDIFGSVTANNSLIEATTGAAISGTANVTGVDPNLAALANNGGPTQTHALPATGSPALDAGANPGSLTTDQRGTGFVRSSGTGVDIGAFENQSGGGGAPPAPVVTDPAAAIFVNANNYSIQGTAQANVLVRIYSDANNDGIVNGADAVVASQQLTGGGTNFSVTTPLLQNMANNFIAKAYNGTLESTGTDVPTINEDSVAPNMVVITDPASAISVMAANYTIQGTAEANSLVRIYRDLNANGVLDAGEPVVGSQQLASGNTNFAISTPLVAASVNRFLATATDAAANSSTPVNVPAITETSVAPTAPPTITTPSAPITVNLANFNIVGTAPANALVRIYRDNNNDGIVNGPDAMVGSQQLVSAGVDFSISVSLNQNAANDFLATAEVSGQVESSVTNVPTITDNTGVSGGTGGGGGGGGGCSTEPRQGAWYALAALLGALWLALRPAWSKHQARKR